MDSEDDIPPPPRRRRRKPEPRGMSTGAIILIVLGIGFVVAVVLGGGVWLAWQGRVKRATDEELRAEREADRVEAAAAFANPVPPTAEESTEFRRIFDNLATALDRGDRAAISSRFDAERLVDELARNGSLDSIPFRDRANFRRGMVAGATASLGDSLVNNELLRWNRTDIRRVRWTADRSEAVVIAVHRQAVGQDLISMKLRWWLIRRGDGWKIYDFEDLDAGMRATMLMKAMLTAGPIQDLVANAQQIRDAADAIRTAMVAIVKEKNVESADQALARCRGRRLPDFFAAMREMIEGLLLLHRGDAVRALERFDASERLQPGMPLLKQLRANAFNLLQRYEEALTLAREYMAELGPDAAVLGQTGYALEGLGRPGEALDSYRAGADDDPDEPTCLAGLLRTLPVEKKDEIGERLAKSRRPMPNFEELLAEARRSADTAGIAALMTWLRRTNPNDVRGRTEAVKQLVDAKKFADAAALLKKELATAKEEEHRPILDAYLFAMIAADRFVEAYESVPKEHAGTAFRTLGEELEEALSDADPAMPAPAGKHLADLIAAHRKHKADDPWLNVYEGTLLRIQGEHAKAEAVFAEGLKKPDARAADAGEPGSVANRLRAGRVMCFIDLKQPLKAYSTVGPSVATFRQLANHFDFGNDPAGLSQLIALHRKAFPAAAELEFWQAEAHFLNAKYDLAARGFAAFHAKADDKFPEWYRTVERCVRSWVRANDVREARAAVAAFGEKNVPANLQAAIEALAGDVLALDRILAEGTKDGIKPWIFYHDEDFIRLTAADKFAAFRAKYPDPRPKLPPQKAG